MAKSKNKLANLPLTNKKALIIVVFLLIFGVYGLYRVVFSSAATAYNISYMNYVRLSKLNSSKVTLVSDPASPYPVPQSPTGTQPAEHYVMQIAPGGKLIYDAPRPTFPILAKTCHVLRSVDAKNHAKVELVSWDVTKRVMVDNSDLYREYCVQSSNLTDGTGKNYNIRHISGGAVNVLHTSWYNLPF